MTINLNTWKHFLNENKQLDELTKKSRKTIEDYIKNDVPDPHKPKYSFDHLFPNGDMRQVIPMEIPRAIQGMRLFRRMTKELGWKPDFKTKTITQKQRQPDGKTAEISQKVPDLKMYKIEKKTIPSGPRAGEKIKKRNEINLGKLVSKEGTEDEKRWWKENQNTLRDPKNVFHWFEHPYRNNFKMASPPVIVLSRHPMDVARMSDFSMTRSCHSEKSQTGHFHCAMAEAKGYGMVAFLINGPDWEAYKLKDKLQDDEIFGDPDIGLDGPEPIARVRLRKLYNKKTGQEFATVENSVYGSRYPDFLPTVRKWARDKQEGVIDIKDGKVTALDPDEWIVLGGDYMDNNPSYQIIGMWKGTDLEKQIVSAFNKIRYKHEDTFGDVFDEKFSEARRKIEQLQLNIKNQVEKTNIELEIEPANDDSDPNSVFSVEVYSTTAFEFPKNVLNIKSINNLSSAQLTPEVGRIAVGRALRALRKDKTAVDIDRTISRAIDLSGVRFAVRMEPNENGDLLITIFSNNYIKDDVDKAHIVTNELINSLDKGYDLTKAAIYEALEKLSILKKSPFSLMVSDLKEMDLPNLIIEAVTDDLSEGVFIENAETIPVATLPLRGPDQNGEQGMPLSREISSILENDAFKKVILENFKAILNKMRAKAAKQLTPSGVKPAEAYEYTIPDSMTVDLVIDSVDPDQDKINMGLNFYIVLPYLSSEDQIKSTISFLKVLNNNIDALVKNNADRVAKVIWQMSYDKAKSQNLQESARNYFSKFKL